MKRSSFNDYQDKRVADEFLDGHKPCTLCQTTTPVNDLATYGARCRRCYDAYCAEANPRNRSAVGPMTLAEKQALIRSIANVGKQGQRGPKDWAYRLREREQGGAYLTRVQRTAWREALKTEIENEARAEEAA